MNDFRNGLVHYLDSLIIEDVKWICDAQFIAITSNILNKHVKFRDIDLLKISRLRKNDCPLDMSSESRSSFHDIEQRSRDNFHNRKRNSNLTIFVMLENKKIEKPAQKTLIKFLKKTILSDHNHIIWSITIKFKEIFKEKYKNFILLNRDYQNYINEIKSVILYMKDILIKFIKELYKEHIIQLKKSEKIFEDYDLDEDIIIESVIFQLIFEDTDSFEYKIMYDLFEHQNKQRSKIFIGVCKSLIHYDVANFDPDLPAIFRLAKDPIPYKYVIADLKNISLCSNPHMKLEILGILEEEIKESVKSYYYEYDDNLSKVSEEKIIYELSKMDIVLGLLSYCIIQSQNEKLLIDLDFIRTLMNQRFIANKSLKFQIFSNIINDNIIQKTIFNYLKPTSKEILF